VRIANAADELGRGRRDGALDVRSQSRELTGVLLGDPHIPVREHRIGLLAVVQLRGLEEAALEPIMAVDVRSGDLAVAEFARLVDLCHRAPESVEAGRVLLVRRNDAE